jgi:predicted ATPase/DNA-binding NarL/FixJ family response regulator
MFGRSTEQAELLEAVHDPTTPLVTVTGRGGVGKTRLAAEVALAAEQAGLVVTTVPLAGVATPELVIPEIAAALGAPTVPGTDGTSALVDRLRAEPMLLLLDNFEHVLGAAPALGDVIDECPQLHVLVTSQTSLRLRRERVVALDPLPLPPEHLDDPDLLSAEPAVAAYCARAAAVDQRFTFDRENAPVVASLCRRLEGLPLAIELAAARSAALPAVEILHRLDESRLDLLARSRSDAPHRHHDLRAAIGWTYGLLDDRQQQLLRWLSVASGSFDLDAAAALLPEFPLTSVIDDLTALVDVHLVDPIVSGNSARYEIPSSIRAFGLEQLDAVGERPAARLAHVRMRAEEARSITEGIRSAEEARWFERLADDHDDLLASLHEAIDGRLCTEALELAEALAPLWESRGYHRAHEAILDQVLELGARAGHASTGYADALLWSAVLGLRQGAAASQSNLLERLERGEELARRLLDDFALLRALECWMAVAPYTGDLERAELCSKEGLELANRLGDERWLGTFEVWAGMLAHLQGDLVTAANLGRTALSRARRLGDRRTVVAATLLLVPLHRTDSSLDVGTPSVEEALTHARATGLALYEALLLTMIVIDAVLARDEPAALRWTDESLRVAATMPTSPVAGYNLMVAMSVAELCGDDRSAARFYGAVRQAVPALSLSMVPQQVKSHEAAVDRIAASLGADSFEREVSAGEEQTWADAIAAARSWVEQMTARLPTSDQPVDATPGDHAGAATLTDRQHEVLLLLAAGLGNKEIATRLGVAPKTVMHHTTAIYRVLGVRGRSEAAAYAVRTGMAN